MAQKDWRKASKTGSGKTSGWRRKDGQGDVYIDILHRNDDERSYPVYAIDKDSNKKLLGYGKAKDPAESWDGAIQNSTKIAKKYMQSN